MKITYICFVSTFRLIFFPLSFLYYCITAIRNFLYEKGILESKEVPVKSIVIGNLSTGGTGKSPVAIYLAHLFSRQMNTAMLSRGYGRKTKGFLEVSNDSFSVDVGDEPLMFKSVFGSDVSVFVSENRNEGIEQLMRLNPNIQLILLDDAFQHRQTKAGFQLVLTTFNSPFYLDYMLPVGNLRESRNGVRRADAIIVTKCPENIAEETKKSILYSLSKYQKPIFFSRIIYGELMSFTSKISQIKNVLLVTGIAETTDLIHYLERDFLVDHMAFPDHHEFTLGDIEKIHRKFDTFASSDKVIVTTFKDYMRLKRNVVSWGLDLFPWYFLPISVTIENETEFIKLIQNYVGKN